MYPFLRVTTAAVQGKRAAPLTPLGIHESHHLCWPWDLDVFGELNNGRTLTLFDIGRVGLAERIGAVRALAGQGWALTIAGSSVRYRRRVRAFDRLIMSSRVIGWDARFLYLEQAMRRRRDDEAVNHALLRGAITSAEGLVPPSRLARRIGWDGPSPELPGWVQAWISAEAERPWPPEILAS